MTRQERKVLEQALGAMNECLFDEQWYAAKDALKDALEAHKALSAEHVAQPEQKPVAWMIWLEGNVGMFSIKRNAQIEFARRNEAYPDDGRKLIPLYTTPPQRKPLTDEMHQQMKESCDNDNMEMRGAFIDGWTSAEAAHGIKE